MTNNKYNALISKLIDSTKENKLVWQKSNRQNGFCTDILNYQVELFHTSSGSFLIGKDKDETYQLTLFDENGECVDSQEIVSSDEGYDNAAILLGEARRSCNKIDDVIQNIIDSI